jgi:uncharacterized membrane protein YGL010W
VERDWIPMVVLAAAALLGPLALVLAFFALGVVPQNILATRAAVSVDYQQSRVLIGLSLAILLVGTAFALLVRTDWSPNSES